MDALADITPDDYRICKDALAHDQSHPARSLATKRWGDRGAWEAVVELWDKLVSRHGALAHVTVWNDGKTITAWPGAIDDYEDPYPWESLVYDERTGPFTPQEFEAIFETPALEHLPVDVYDCIPPERLAELHEMVSRGEPEPPDLVPFELGAWERLSHDIKKTVTQVDCSHIVKIDIARDVDRLFDDSSLPSDGRPVAVIIWGGIASGKTTFRKQRYSTGYVLIDAADVFHSLCRGELFPFPGPFEEPVNLIGQAVTRRALSERRNIVTEIVGYDSVMIVRLIEALKSIGYRVSGEGMSCSIEKAVLRNRSRGPDNISAYDTESYQRTWIMQACAELAKGRARRRAKRTIRIVDPQVLEGMLSAHEHKSVPMDLVRFYRHEQPDASGRWLRDIWSWDSDRLERTHDYIQWLFPTRKMGVNPDAPILDEEVISEFRRDERLQGELLVSFRQLLAFYGFLLQEGEGALSIEKILRLAAAIGQLVASLEPQSSAHHTDS